MEYSFKLDLLLKELPPKYKTESLLIREIISAVSINKDLNEAYELSKEFRSWHELKLLPARQLNGHDLGHEGRVNKALYIATLTSLVRALDKNSKGRKKIDLVEYLSSSGHAADIALLHRFRDTELAHYDKFKIDEMLHSTDSATLMMENGKCVRIYPAGRRYGSSGLIMTAAENIIKAALPYTEAFFRKKSLELKDLIDKNSELSQLIYSSFVNTGYDMGPLSSEKIAHIEFISGMNVEF